MRSPELGSRTRRSRAASPCVLMLSAAIVLTVGATPAGADALPRFEPGPCPFLTADAAPVAGLECGSLVVAQDRANPQGRELRLAVAILRSTATAPEPDPVIWLSGGPGGGSLAAVPARVDMGFWKRLRQKRDLVFFDQRGTGFSEPAFCDEVDLAMYYGLFEGLSREDLLARQRAALAECRARMEADGIDLAHYNSVTSAQDVRDLRVALGYERVNLAGGSYGTRLALVTMREFPNDIRAALLDGITTPDLGGPIVSIGAFDRSLRRVFDGCAADPACRDAFPNLEADFIAAMEDLSRQPLSFPMRDAKRFPEGKAVIDGKLFGAGIHQGLYNRAFIPLVPLVIREARARNEAVMAQLANALVVSPDQYIDHGLFYAVECFEQHPLTPHERWVAEGALYPQLARWHDAEYSSRAQEAACAIWQPARATPEQLAPTTSDIPTLLLSGEFDPITPPESAIHAARMLSRATLAVARGAGHGTIRVSACTEIAAAAFLENPDAPVDVACFEEAEPVRFVSDVRMTPGLGAVASDAMDGQWLVPGALVALAASLALSTLAWPVAWMRSRRRERPHRVRVAQLATRLAALTGVVFTAGLTYSAIRAIEASPFLLAFGVPARFAWLFVLPWIVGLLGAGGFVAWMLAGGTEGATRGARLRGIIVAGAAIGLAALSIAVGLR